MSGRFSNFYLADLGVFTERSFDWLKEPPSKHRFEKPSKKNPNISFVEKYYSKAFRIKKVDRRIPTAFVKIGKNADMKYNYHVDEFNSFSRKNKVRF